MSNENTILLVEDNPDDAELTSRAFRDSTLTNHIVHVTDGRLALDYLFGEGAHAGRDLAAAPDLILLDLSLPGMAGLDVLGHLRADPRTDRIPVVVLTGSSAEEDMIRSYNLGANSFVRKSFHFQHYFAAIRQLERYWLIPRAPRSRSRPRKA
jgi:CheY-like chemotaxis protein